MKRNMMLTLTPPSSSTATSLLSEPSKRYLRQVRMSLHVIGFKPSDHKSNALSTELPLFDEMRDNCWRHCGSYNLIFMSWSLAGNSSFLLAYSLVYATFRKAGFGILWDQIKMAVTIFEVSVCLCTSLLHHFKQDTESYSVPEGWKLDVNGQCMHTEGAR